jgi:hypothetical protein
LANPSENLKVALPGCFKRSEKARKEFLFAFSCDDYSKSEEWELRLVQCVRIAHSPIVRFADIAAVQQDRDPSAPV